MMSMETVGSLRNYIRLMVNDVVGVKVLLLDNFTKKLVSLVYTHTEILREEVLLIDMIDNPDRDQLSHLHCVIFIRPTLRNATMVRSELLKPKYGQYSLFFTNVASFEILNTLAEGDRHCLIESVREHYIDFLAPDEGIFSLGLRSVASLYFHFHETEDVLLGRIVEGLVSCALSSGLTTTLIRSGGGHHHGHGHGHGSPSEESLVHGRRSRTQVRRVRPVVRFRGNSAVCKKVAELFCSALSAEPVSGLFGPVSSGSAGTFTRLGKERERELRRRRRKGRGGRGAAAASSASGSGASNGTDSGDGTDSVVFLILDRRHDAVTPLLTQWTYQAMVHELFGSGIRDGIVTLKQKVRAEPDEDEGEVTVENQDDDLSTSRRQRKEVLFSSLTDDFLRRNMFSNWGELCVEIKKLVEGFKSRMDSTHDFQTIDQIREFMESYSTTARMNIQVNDHMDVVFAMKDAIRRRNLMALSRLEQEMVCGNANQKEATRSLMEILSGVVRKDDALRLFMLYCLRYQGSSEIGDIYRLLKRQGFEDSELWVHQAILKYGGERIRQTNELFGQLKGLAGIFRRVKSALRDAENVFTQHVPLLKTIATNCFMGRLDEELYPYYDLTLRTKPSRVVVFVVGGITYEEARAVNELRQEGRDVILGGTGILNAKMFVREVERVYKAEA